MKYLKTYNESIRHLLKPKNEDDVIKAILKLSNEEKFERAIQYEIYWLIIELLDSGYRPEWDLLEYAYKTGKMDLIKIYDEYNILDNNMKLYAAIYAAYAYNKYDVVSYLSNNKFFNSILNILPEDLLEKINKNESIRHLLKPKKFIEDIEKNISNIPLDRLLELSIKHEYLYGIKYVFNKVFNKFNIKYWLKIKLLNIIENDIFDIIYNKEIINYIINNKFIQKELPIVVYIIEKYVYNMNLDKMLDFENKIINIFKNIKIDKLHLGGFMGIDDSAFENIYYLNNDQLFRYENNSKKIFRISDILLDIIPISNNNMKKIILKKLIGDYFKLNIEDISIA